ncbi:MAG: hypothetical protein AAF768_01010 [Pseudomonadota bacterium]
MKDNIDHEHVVDELKSLGVPDETAAEIAPAWRIYLLRWFGNWIAFVTMVSGFIAGGVFVSPFLEALNNNIALNAAQETNALMYDTNFGFGLLVLLIAWILISGMTASALTWLTRMPISGAIFLGTLSDVSSGKWNTELTTKTAEKFNVAPSADRFIAEWSKGLLWRMLKYAIPLTLVGLFALARDVNTYSVYGTNGYHRNPLLPWAKAQIIPWSEASSVELGCNQTDDGGSLVYKVKFNNGKSVRIEDGVPIHLSWLESLEAIDRRITAAGAEFVRWEWLNRDSMHPKCLRGYYGYLGPHGGDRFMALLRSGELPGDVK